MIWYQILGQHLCLFLGCSCNFSYEGYVFLFTSFGKCYFHLLYKDTLVLSVFSNISVDLQHRFKKRTGKLEFHLFCGMYMHDTTLLH